MGYGILNGLLGGFGHISAMQIGTCTNLNDKTLPTHLFIPLPG
jgi:hypothetical protein